MSKQTASLTELQIKRAKPQERATRLADGKALYLQVDAHGSKHWRMEYRFDNKEKVAAFGV
jgi:hypothetical protein